METLWIQGLDKSFVQWSPDDDLDEKYKPGLYRQVENFLKGSTEDFCTIQQQSDIVSTYYYMANY